jgi:eukaryotic-like serine/threonine-protein kinase
MGHWRKSLLMGTSRTCSSCGDEIAGTAARCPKDGTALYSDEVMSRVGMRLKDHEIQGVIGEGGMGVVYRAQHVVIEKPVAIKVLHDGFARQKEMVEQFLVEAKAASRIRHPNIIDVTDFGTTPEGLVFLVMEYLEGESLEHRIEQVGRIPVFEAINIIKQVARGLGAAHAVGVIHRDLKPANIFLCRREGRRRIVRRTEDASGTQFVVEPETSYDFVKLLDFGVAKLMDLGPSAATRAGALCGSPYYLSPEQAQEHPATERSDIYSLGATFFEMVTGTVPFPGRSMLEILNGHVWGAVVPPSQRAPDAGIDPRLDALILKCLEKDPQRRFANLEEIGDALRECVTDRAFLRDAHRLPGIRESGIDLSAASPEARGAAPAPPAPRFEKGFSEVERERDDIGAGADDEAERPRRKEFPGNTMRIPRTHGPGLLLGLAVLALVAIGALVWSMRGPSESKALVPIEPPRPAPVVASTPPPPPPPPAPAVAAEPAAPVVADHARPTAVPPAAAPSPVVATAAAPAAGDQPATEATKPIVARSQPSAGGSGRVRLPTLPPVLPEPTVAQPVPPSPPPAPPVAEPAPVAAPAAEVEALLREAQQAWTRQYYAVAIDKARAVLKADPRRQAAHQIIAVCSCAVGAADDAKEAVSHLDDHKRKLVESLCQRHGVTLE